MRLAGVYYFYGSFDHMYRDCPERTSVAEGSRGRAILDPTVGVSKGGVGATFVRGRGRG